MARIVDQPKVVIRSDGTKWMTRVEVDGKPLPNVTRVVFDTGDTRERSDMVTCRIEMFASLDISIDPEKDGWQPEIQSTPIDTSD